MYEPRRKIQKQDVSAFCGCVLEIIREGFLGDVMAAAAEKSSVVLEGRLDF